MNQKTIKLRLVHLVTQNNIQGLVAGRRSRRANQKIIENAYSAFPKFLQLYLGENQKK